MQSSDAVVEHDGEGVETHALFGSRRECGEFEQRVLRFAERSDDRCDKERDEVLYALSGNGEATIGGERSSLATGTAAFVAAVPVARLLRSPPIVASPLPERAYSTSSRSLSQRSSDRSAKRRTRCSNSPHSRLEPNRAWVSTPSPSCSTTASELCMQYLTGAQPTYVNLSKGARVRPRFQGAANRMGAAASKRG